MTYRLSAVLAFAAACGSKTPATTTTTAPAKAKKAPLPPGLVWKDMNLDQREQFMEETVLPKTKELFVAFDATTYASMDCRTCHGDGVDDGTFEMPNKKIKPLPATPEAFMAWVQSDARAAKYAQFMHDKLEPTVADLLHMESFNPQTKTGDFSCSNCHYLVDASGKVFPAPTREHEHHHDHGDDHDHDHDNKVDEHAH